MPAITETVLFLVRSLGRGGAERQLVALAKGLSRQGYPVAVALFFGGGVFVAELAAAGVRVIDLRKQGRWDVLPFLFRLARVLRDESPAVLHGYLSVPNILCVLFKPLLRGARVVWGVRASNMDLSRYDWLSRVAFMLECRLARFADCIIANSYAGMRHAVKHGFPESKTVVIPNGIDTDYFQFDPDSRKRLRAEWKLVDDVVLVGLVGRIDPMKDHATFLEAASRIAAKRPAVRFVCVGDGLPAYAPSIKRLAASLGLENRLIWAGARDDMPAVYSALDIACSSSAFGEGFANTIAEAMACAAPCVVTDVGDSALVAGPAATIVAPGDGAALARGVLDLIDLAATQRRALGAACRQRIVAEFAVNRLVQRTELVLGLTKMARQA